MNAVRLLGVVALALASTPAAAASEKLGVVDVRKVMEAVPAWGKAVAALKKEWQGKQEKLQADQEVLRKAKDRLDAKRAVSDPKAIAREQAQLIQKAQALAGDFVKQQKLIAAQELALKDQMLKRIEPLVTKIANAGEYSFVFETGTHQAPNVLYADKRIDLTKKVIARYKEHYKNQPFKVGK